MTSHPGAIEEIHETASVAAPVRARSERRNGWAGFTLLELLVVIALLTLLAGLGAGAYQMARRNYSLSAAASHVEGLLQAARNTAVSGGMPVRVVVDAPARTFTAHALENLGEWSFESDRGPLGDPVRLEGARYVSEGYIGRAVDLGAGGYVDCGNSSRYDVRAGLHAEARVYPARPLSDPAPADPRRGSRRTPTASTVLAKGEAYSLGITPDGALEGRIGDYRVRTAPRVVLPGRWTRVTLRFDGEVSLLADGIRRPALAADGETPGRSRRRDSPKSIPLDDGPLTIGSPAHSFPGRIDEVRLRGLVEPLQYHLDPTFSVLGWKKEIHFDDRGHLDSRFHERPVRIVLHEGAAPTESPSRTRVAMDFSKTFREWVRSRGPGGEERTEDGEERRLEARLGDRQKVELVVDRIGTVR